MTRSTKFRLLAAVAVTVGLLTSLLGPVATPASAVADVTTERLGGADRFATAAEVARESHPGAQTALIANGFNFPDALAGSTLAGALNAPILLVTPTSIPAATSAALSDIGVDDVVILGGPAAVSTQVENQLRTNYGVTRVQGDDRYKTAVEIARRAAVGGVGTVDNLRTAFVSTGLNYPDALGAGPLAYEGNLPSLLTRTNDLPPETAQVIRDLNIEHVVILGGTQAISDTVKTQIEATGASTERLNGKNRAETATFVADFALGRMDFEGVNVILARGDNFPDALAGGPLGGERRAVILLTATSCQLAIETRLWLEEHYGTIARIFILGGPSAICDAVAREAEAAAETNNLPPSQVDLTISGGSMNGGPHWQYQQSGASPSKSLTLSAFVSSDPSEGADEDADRVPAAREDVIFNIKPTAGDNAANTELNLTARTDSNGVARVSYTRAQPGTDIITVRLKDDASLTDDGVGRWNTEEMPMSLTPDTAQNLAVNQPRAFTVCVPGPEGDAPTPEGTEINLTTLELVDDDPENDTNVAALRFSSDVEDDRADNDETVGKVTTRDVTAVGEAPDGCADFTVSSNAAQIFTLMAFIDSVATPAANDDNTNPPEYRDIAGTTAFGSTASGLNVSPPNDDDSSTAINRRNGQQIVYTVSAVDAQGQPLSGPIDVSFQELVDNQGATTTNAEFDWFDNSATPSTQEGSENQVPTGATAAPAGTTRIEVVPNANGVFTFAVVQPSSRVAPTTGTPIAWIDVPGGNNNRPDATEPQSRGENFTYATGSPVNATLEVLGCPPGTDQRGWPGDADPNTTGTQAGNNPFDAPDPCLGMDQPESTTAQPHVPWRLDVAAESEVADAATCEVVQQAPAPTAEDPEATRPVVVAPADPSRGDVVFRFTLRDPQGRRLRDNIDTLNTTENQVNVTFRVSFDGAVSDNSVGANRPNRLSNTNNLSDCSAPTTTIDTET
ncbi:MAG TPA: cell wall-binding repeat-containing protein, partial [Acidimicrobiales bacterium]|nr:cell wall-binding repeat-containing protein [Acidimicrobiales bacterium]